MHGLFRIGKSVGQSISIEVVLVIMFLPVNVTVQVALSSVTIELAVVIETLVISPATNSSSSIVKPVVYSATFPPSLS